MPRLLYLLVLIALLTLLAACTRRMAPFAPHRTNSDFHRTAQTNQACLGCHEIKKISRGHGASDDCLRCHRILQGE
ncbi:MAG: hypothetical protein FDZ69_03930 [Deltaproteobacteria bacterium]|nr:MAG: hypothetical protein FDZ69_03930 [Deltaproteobacteria bacterium]